jgi:hypothetical protein
MEQKNASGRAHVGDLNMNRGRIHVPLYQSTKGRTDLKGRERVLALSLFGA